MIVRIIRKTENILNYKAKNTKNCEILSTSARFKIKIELECDRGNDANKIMRWKKEKLM